MMLFYNENTYSISTILKQYRKNTNTNIISKHLSEKQF